MAGEGASFDEKMSLSPHGATAEADGKWRRTTTEGHARRGGDGGTEDDKDVLERLTLTTPSHS
eukprot:CAMPEP_0113241672 /NCGR_PEP_ID=MMETSP0008_2-20120614/6922_1 /TAXON_ID=97485 /ORGANISM="Prymnesium parvum" /LENGTH=62 /DNA_ID=CAMNT_0000089097 /DNA_START=91 /DNA_END=277 /DNA_ORIENTATION=- /assembly_acc=CAM_ASM_000153